MNHVDFSVRNYTVDSIRAYSREKLRKMGPDYSTEAMIDLEDELPELLVRWADHAMQTGDNRPYARGARMALKAVARCIQDINARRAFFDGA